jgi:elongation factor Ts
LPKQKKKADRASSEGTVAIALSDDHKQAAMLALNCETDFVGRNENFIALANDLAGRALAAGVKTLEELEEYDFGGKKGRDFITEAVLKLGENIKLGDYHFVSSEGFLTSYIHMNGKIGVVVAMHGPEVDASVAAGRNVAMQVAAMKPLATRRDGVPAELVEKEKEIYKEQIRQSGKPEHLLDKIAEGKLNKYFSEVTLLEQNYVKEAKLTIADYLAQVSKEVGDKVDVRDFTASVIGE